MGLLIPRTVLAWNGVPWRLYVLEASALAFGLLTLWGLIVLIFRRITSARIRAVTSPMDIVLLLVLLVQVLAGLWIATSYRWGSSWYAGFAVPYLWSILKLSPDIVLVANLPFAVKFHIVDHAHDQGLLLIFANRHAEVDETEYVFCGEIHKGRLKRFPKQRRQIQVRCS